MLNWRCGWSCRRVCVGMLPVVLLLLERMRLQCSSHHSHMVCCSCSGEAGAMFAPVNVLEEGDGKGGSPAGLGEGEDGHCCSSC